MMQVYLLMNMEGIGEMLYPCNAKPIYGKAFKHRDWVLTAFGHGGGGLMEVSYVVADRQTGAMFGLGETKRDALSDFRQYTANLSAEEINALCARHQAKVDAWRADREEHRRRLEEKWRKEKPKALDRKRAEVFEKSKGQCHYCEKKLEFAGKWHVEHYIPRARGGSNHIRNLVASCVDCNLEKRVRTGDEYKASLNAA